MRKRSGFRWGVKGSILILIFVMFCGVIYIKEISEKIVKQNKIHVQEVTSQISSNVSNKIQSSIHSLKLIGNNLALNETISTEELSKVLEFEIKHGSFGKIIVANLDGEGIDSNNKRINIGETKYFKDTIEKNELVLEHLDSTTDDKNTIVYSIPIRQGDKTLGVICGISNPNLARNQIETKLYGNKGTYYILAEDGSIVLDKHGKIKRNNNRNVIETIIGMQMKNLNPNVDIPKQGIDTANIHGKYNYIAYSKIKAADGWYVVTSIPVSSVFIDTNSILLITVIVLVLGILGFVILSIYTIKHDYNNKQKLNKAVYEDHLTEINNYEKFIIDCSEYLENSHKNECAFILFDIRKFKVLNDIYGYQVGDNILKDISKSLKYIFNDSAIYARLSGDTFGILVEIEDTDKDISRLSHIIKEEIVNSNNMVNVKLDIKIETSIGVCIVDKKDNNNIQKLIDNADMARFKSKSMSYKQYLIFDENMREEKKIIMKLEQDLFYAIRKSEFHIYYQPKFDTELNGVIGCEALLRWIHPTLGFVSPDRFIPIAEKNGHINLIGKWVFDEVCKTINLWQDEGIDVVPVSVNLSRVELYQDNLVSFLKDTLERYNVSSKLVELEITETTTLNNSEFIISRINQIKELGIKVSMDDFGVGNSNISNLKEIPIDVLKIDRSILMDIDTNIKSRVVVESILNICRHLNLEVVGEGVENMDQIEILKYMGCKVIQGYVFYKPMPKKEYRDLLKSNKKENELFIKESAIDYE